MAGEWIKVEKSTADKPEVLRMARELLIDRDAVFGKLMLVWMWFDANSVDGVVDGAVDADVDALVRHVGFASVMKSVNWLAEVRGRPGLSLPNFGRHNGETAKKRALSNRRQSRWRNADVDAPSVTNASTREEKRRSNKTNPPNGGSTVWDFGKSLLAEQGLSTQAAGALIGSWLREWGEPEVADALRSAAGKADAKAYVAAILKSKPKKGVEMERKVAL
jgi:hypothetical protein